MNNQESVLFFDDPRVLYGQYFTNIIPRKNDNMITKANTTMRLVIIVTFIIAGIIRNISILAMIPLVGCLIGIYLHPSLAPTINQSPTNPNPQIQVMNPENREPTKNNPFMNYQIDQITMTNSPSKQTLVSETREPTKDNPFMNYQIDQITTTDNSKPLLPEHFTQNNHKVRMDMENQFQLGIVDNENDIWGRKFASYHFYTIPNNSATPDPNGAFQNWLYGRNYPTCKEDPRYCDVKPARTIDGGDGVMDRSLPFSIGLDLNTKRRIAKGEMRSLQNIKAQ